MIPNDPHLGRLQQKTLVTDFCWVCNHRFRTSTPPGLANREDHHIVPRNAGGSDGPQVSLCDTHHAVVHKIASKAKSKQDFSVFVAGEPEAHRQKLLWLASIIVRAEKTVDEDPNKHFSSPVRLSTQETLMIRRLQGVYPKKSRSDLLKMGLHVLYKSHYPK